MDISVFLYGVDSRNVGMIEAGGSLGFTAEPGKTFWVTTNCIRQNLDGNLTIQFAILSKVYLVY